MEVSEKGSESTVGELAGRYSAEELALARPPILSLIRKSEKARQKLNPGSWQYRRLTDNLKALHIGMELMSGENGDASFLSPESSKAALCAIGDMIARTQTAQLKFAPGTAQHSLLQNRLFALRVAEDLLR